MRYIKCLCEHSICSAGGTVVLDADVDLPGRTDEKPAKLAWWAVLIVVIVGLLFLALLGLLAYKYLFKKDAPPPSAEGKSSRHSHPCLHETDLLLVYVVL